MKVILEHISPDENSSFRVLHIKGVPISELNWQYHYHSEIEIVCVLHGRLGCQPEQHFSVARQDLAGA